MYLYLPGNRTTSADDPSKEMIGGALSFEEASAARRVAPKRTGALPDVAITLSRHCSIFYGLHDFSRAIMYLRM